MLESQRRVTVTWEVSFSPTRRRFNDRPFSYSLKPSALDEKGRKMVTPKNSAIELFIIFLRHPPVKKNSNFHSSVVIRERSV